MKKYIIVTRSLTLAAAAILVVGVAGSQIPIQNASGPATHRESRQRNWSIFLSSTFQICILFNAYIVPII